MKIWRGNEKTDDKIIALINSTIYKGNPPNTEIEDYISELNKGIVPSKYFIGIPFHYLREINMQEGKSYLEIKFGLDSVEHFTVTDELARLQIFEYFRSNIPNCSYSVEKYSKLKAGKKPLIAMLVLTGLFLWTLYYAFGYDQGYQYEIKNGHYGSLTGIILSIASYGVKKTTTIFLLLLLVAFLAFLKKSKTPPVISHLNFNQ